MVKQVLLPIVVVMIFIAAVGVFLKKSGGVSIPQTMVQKTITIEGKNIKVEVANTKEQREKGLSDRSSLEENSGMLFVFDSKDVAPGFWMKGMLIPLDIIWINDGKIVKIDKNIPPPTAGTDEKKLKIYSPPSPIDEVLEVNAGFSDKNGFKTGSSVTLPSL